MDAKILLVVVSTALVVTGLPLADPEGNQNFVPGVFISADALKDLQQKAQENQMNGQINGQVIPAGNHPITNANPGISRNEELNHEEQLKVGSAYPTNPSSPGNVRVESQNQPILPNQPNQQVAQNLQNQPMLPVQNQPQIMNQPAVPNQQQVLLNQPNQPQPILVSQQPQPTYVSQQPQPNYVSQQPQSTYVSQQPQPAYVSQQPAGQLYVNPQTNQQVILRNGQIAQVLPQGTIVATSPNQPTLYQNTNPNGIQNPGATLYAMVPVNGPNTMPAPSTNVANGNTYLVPVQQTPANQIYAVSG